jgi:microcompartment protein CcmL/EutN
MPARGIAATAKAAASNALVSNFIIPPDDKLQSIIDKKEEMDNYPAG